jgi:hypothetical protein
VTSASKRLVRKLAGRDHISRQALASYRSLCSTAIALLLVILVRSLRYQGWRDLRWQDRGALLHGGGTCPFDRQWGGPISMPSPRSLCYKRFRQVRRRIFEECGLTFLFLILSDHFYAPSGWIRPNLSNFCRNCCDHERPTQPIRYAATAVFEEWFAPDLSNRSLLIHSRM